MKRAPRPEAQASRTLRAAAHVHSEWSDDGSWSLERIARTFGRLGHDIVLMSEHSRGFTATKWAEYVDACKQASSDSVLIVPGMEYNDDADVVHIPVWGDVPFFGPAPPIGHLLQAVSQAGGAAVWAHPWRRDAWRVFEPSWVEHLTAVEVWNRKYDGIAPSRKALELAERQGARPVVALDFHTRRQLFPLTLRLEAGAAAAEGPGKSNAAAEGPGKSNAAAEGPGKLNRAPTVGTVYEAIACGRFAPRAGGIPLDRLTHGPAAAMLQGLERTRRGVARFLR